MFKVPKNVWISLNICILVISLKKAFEKVEIKEKAMTYQLSLSLKKRFS